MEREFGGFAFPQTDFLVDGSTANYGDAGMTLRDYFAAQAMQAILSEAETFWEGVAPLAYQYADAMLKARET